MSEAPLSHDEQGPEQPPAPPRWVALLVIGALAVLVLLVLGMLLIGGDHGPGMHGG